MSPRGCCWHCQNEIFVKNYIDYFCHFLIQCIFLSLVTNVSLIFNYLYACSRISCHCHGGPLCSQIYIDWGNSWKPKQNVLHVFSDKSLRITLIITLRPRQNGRRFTDDTFKRIFLNENIRITIKISLQFAPKGPINNIPALVQIMAWRQSGDKPLSEPMMVSLLSHICVTRPWWVINY